MWNEINKPDAPACFTRRQWQSYQEAALMEPPLQAGYCQDCTASYQLEMLRAGRCKHPEVWFDKNGEGHRSERKTEKRAT